MTTSKKLPSLTVASFLVVLSCFITTALHAQKDSLILKNGNVIVGVIKSLDKDVLVVGTDYSSSDFTIVWSGIKEIYCSTSLRIKLKDGQCIDGTFRSADGGAKLIITGIEGQQTETTPENVVSVEGIKSTFWSRTHASVDLGLSITRANNLVQYNMRSTVGYVADKWFTEIYYDDLRSKQDSVAQIKRTASGASFTYFLPRDWYSNAALTTLANTEQSLKMRFSAKAGIGKYIVSTARSRVGLGLGLSVSDETFTNGTPKRTSLEGYVGTEVNLIDLGDFSLFNTLYVYPSFTESGRWRTDFKLDAKYNLPLDVYLKFGVTVNYDNMPAEAGKETDYIYVFSVGWSL